MAKAAASRYNFRCRGGAGQEFTSPTLKVSTRPLGFPCQLCVSISAEWATVPPAEEGKSARLGGIVLVGI